MLLDTTADWFTFGIAPTRVKKKRNRLMQTRGRQFSKYGRRVCGFSLCLNRLLPRLTIKQTSINLQLSFQQIRIFIPLWHIWLTRNFLRRFPNLAQTISFSTFMSLREMLLQFIVPSVLSFWTLTINAKSLVTKLLFLFL